MSDEDQTTGPAETPADQSTNSDPLDPSGIAQFVERDRCPRYISQRVEPDPEAESRDWTEAFGLMNVALLGHGKTFEAAQIEALAANATTIIGPELDATATDGVPSISIDETWAESDHGRRAQLQRAIDTAADLAAPGDDTPYILCYQAPLGGQLGAHEVWGEADCLVLAPGEALAEEPTADPPAVVARVLDIKSASEQQPAHRVQVAIYSALLERTLAEGPTPSCRIETSVLTQASAAEPDSTLDPFDLPTFRRAEWELFTERLLAADGPIEEALTDDLDSLPFTIDQVCDNCAYSEACSTRAVEDPTDPRSLALLGLDASVQRALQASGITTIRELATLAPRLQRPHPTDEPPALDLEPDTRRALEEALPGPIHETVQRAQALRGPIDPDSPTAPRPPAITGREWVPLPDDRCEGWGGIDGATPGTLVHVALFVRPDTARDRIAALGACVSADAHDDYHTIGEVTEAVPDDPVVADTVEADLVERFLAELFETIETVAAAVGDSTEAGIHCYTFSEHEQTALTEACERHSDDLPAARALRNLLSLHPDGHTERDQALWSAVQPVCNDAFALQYPSQGLLAVAEQFVPNWTIEAFDPLDARGDAPPLRAIFREQWLNARVPYLDATPGIRLHLARGPLAEGPAVAAADTTADSPDPDGWYPIRKRAGGQFPLEYVWAAVPANPDDESPRLTPDTVEAWGIDAEDQPLYRQEIAQFSDRTAKQNEPIQRGDITALVERLSYTLMRVIESIPYKDTYYQKAPLDVTQLQTADPPATGLPAAARDYLRIEHGTQREATLEHYRHPLRARARSGRSVPIRCTDIDQQDDGSLTITGELAFEALFEPEAAARIATRTRLHSGDGPGGGSWRVLTGLDEAAIESPGASQPTDDSAQRARPERGVETAAAIQHSPPVLVEALDQQAGTITLTAFPHRFRRTGSEFRVDHCGWDAPLGSNLDNPERSPAERDGYVAGRPPVWIDTGELFMLDPLLDNFGAPKTDRALRPDTVAQNALWQQIQLLRRTGINPPALVCPPAPIEAFLDTMSETAGCLDPTRDQADFIRATERALVPLQGPPGTGKTSGATAPALLARAAARAAHDRPFVGVVVAPSHEAVDAVLASVTDLLDTWRQADNGLADLDLVRVLPSAPPATDARVDTATPTVDVTYANYHNEAGADTLRALAADLAPPAGTTVTPTRQLVFTTPATLYQLLGIVAETLPRIDGDSAPAAMRHGDGLADVVCLDEASMLDVPQLVLAGSTLKPTGQTLLVGDHRQLPTVTQTDWTEIRRESLTQTQATRSALEYVQWLTATIPARSPTRTPDGAEAPRHRPGQETVAATRGGDSDGS